MINLCSIVFFFFKSAMHYYMYREIFSQLNRGRLAGINICSVNTQCATVGFVTRSMLEGGKRGLLNYYSDNQTPEKNCRMLLTIITIYPNLKGFLPIFFVYRLFFFKKNRDLTEILHFFSFVYAYLQDAAHKTHRSKLTLIPLLIWLTFNHSRRW